MSNNIVVWIYRKLYEQYKEMERTKEEILKDWDGQHDITEANVHSMRHKTWCFLERPRSSKAAMVRGVTTSWRDLGHTRL